MAICKSVWYEVLYYTERLDVLVFGWGPCFKADKKPV